MRPVRLAAALAALTLVLAGCGDQPARQGAEGASPSPSASGPTDAEIDDELRKGFDTASKADLRNLATQEETLLTDTNSYGTIAQIEANQGVDSVKVSAGVTMKVVAYDAANAFCLSAKHQFSENTWFYDSARGGLLPVGATSCPETKGTAGDEKAGERLPADFMEKEREERRKEFAKLQEAREKARAAGPITEEERAQAAEFLIGEILGDGRNVLYDALQEARPASTPGKVAKLPTLTELKASGVKVELPAGTSYEMTHLEVGSGEFGDDSFCLKATHELLQKPVYLTIYDVLESPQDCTIPRVDGGELRGLALSAAERAGLERQIEAFALDTRMYTMENPSEPEEPAEEPDPLTDSLRNLATAQETFLTDTNSYGSIAQLQSTEPPGPYLTGSSLPAPGVTVTVVAFDEANGFCLKAEKDGVVRFYDSAAGGVLPDTATGCTATTKGTPGGSLQG